MLHPENAKQSPSCADVCVFAHLGTKWHSGHICVDHITDDLKKKKCILSVTSEDKHSMAFASFLKLLVLKLFCLGMPSAGMCTFTCIYENMCLHHFETLIFIS